MKGCILLVNFHSRNLDKNHLMIKRDRDIAICGKCYARSRDTIRACETCWNDSQLPPFQMLSQYSLKWLRYSNSCVFVKAAFAVAAF